MQSDPFEHFTEEARQAMALAKEEALRFKHNYIGAEHQLLGLIRQETSVAGRALKLAGVELDKTRNALEFIIGRGDRIILSDIALTPRAKKVITLAREEAQRLGSAAIGPEHLLLGLLREGEGIAAGVLESLGVTLEKARQAVEAILQQQAGD